MRLWHKDLIGVLPKNQLSGQWRELGVIFKEGKDNSFNHLLINFIPNYDKKHLCAYSYLVIKECLNREYNLDLNKYLEYFSDILNKPTIGTFYEDIFSEKMNDIYLRECLYNIEEKYICGGIKQSEWDLIYNKFNKKFDLYNKK